MIRLPARRMIGQIGLFGLIGVFNTLVDIVLFWLLTTRVGIAPIAANLLSFSTGAVSSFLLNGRVTFRAASGERKGKALRFAVTTLITLAASTASLACFLLVMSPMAGKLLSVGVSFAIGFLLQRNWVFVQRAPLKSGIASGKGGE